MNIKKVDDKPMVIHTKEKPKLKVKGAPETKIKGRNVLTVQYGPKAAGTVAEKSVADGKIKLKKSSVHVTDKRKTVQTKTAADGMEYRGRTAQERKGSGTTQGRNEGKTAQDRTTQGRQGKEQEVRQSVNKENRMYAQYRKTKAEKEAAVKKKPPVSDAVVSVAARTALDEIDGGNEVHEAYMAAYTLAKPATNAVDAGRNLYRSKAAKSKQDKLSKKQSKNRIKEKAVKESAVKTARKTAQKAAKETAKETGKKAAKEASKAAAKTAAATAGTGAGGVLAGIVAGEAAGIAMDKRDVKNSTRNRMIKLFVAKLRQEVSVYTIVERLKAGGIESPERHKRRAGTRNGGNIQGGGWCPSTIRGILQNRAYIGEMICGKSETALYKGLKKRLTEKDNWIVVSDAHPPIVSVSDFEAVERQMREDSAHRETAMEWSADIRAGMIDLFAGKIFCADCGKRMYYKRQRICGCKNVTFRGVYDCSTHVRRGHATCFNHFIRQDALNEKVFNAIRDQLQVALDYERLLLAMRGGSGEASVREKHKAAVASVKLRLNALKKKRAGLYESYVEGILNEEEYAFAKQTYEEQYEALNRLLDEAVERRERFLASISPDNKWLTMMRGAAGMTGLTQELVDAMIEKVLVYDGSRIEVVFNYNDVFYAMLECVEQIKEAGGDD